MWNQEIHSQNFLWQLFHIHFLLNQWKHVLPSRNDFQYSWDNHPCSPLLNGILGERKPWGVIIIIETFRVKYTCSQNEKQDQEAKIKLLFKCVNLSVKCADVVRYCYFDVLQIDRKKKFLFLWTILSDSAPWRQRSLPLSSVLTHKSQ